ncbi:MAG: acetate--CoA ligase family protein [Candidatus Aenigmatarchaeota archaeon]
MKPTEIFEKVRKEKRVNLNEIESREVLKYYGIPVVEGIVTNSIEEAVYFAEKKGYPVVLKIVSRDIIHKTDIGGVITNIKNERDLRDAFNQIIKNVRERAPKARIDGIFVQKMLPKSPEVIVGGKSDPTFDKVILFGIGGIFVEVFEDVSFRVIPITLSDAKEMISEIKGSKILMGIRGQDPVDLKSLADILLRTSKMLQENQEIKELDINPIFAMKKGAVAVDARIIIE